MTWAQVAQRHGVSPRTARQACTDHAAAAGAEPPADMLPAGDPLAVSAEDGVGDGLRAFPWASGQLRRLVGKADNTSAAVGAIRTAVAVEEARLNALITAGVIPSVE